MKKLLSIILAGLTALSLAACGAPKTDPNPTPNNQPEKVVIKMGVVGDASETWDFITDKLAEDGIELQIVKFSDYTLVNQSLHDGDIDLNSFQHYAFLKNDCEAKNLDLTVIGETIIAPLGLYSTKITDLSELKEGDKIAIPSDATNGGRSLKVLEAAGLIKVDPAAGFLPIVSDITENPLKLEFVEVEAALTASLLPDVAAAMINGGHAVDNGLIPAEDAVYLEEVSGESDNPYINIIVARTADKDNASYLKVVEYYHTDEVAQIIEEQYKGSYIPVWKQ